jgi:hypothetical protein
MVLIKEALGYEFSLSAYYMFVGSEGLGSSGGKRGTTSSGR